jgi:hypothetical protein
MTERPIFELIDDTEACEEGLCFLCKTAVPNRFNLMSAAARYRPPPRMRGFEPDLIIVDELLEE